MDLVGQYLRCLRPTCPFKGSAIDLLGGSCPECGGQVAVIPTRGPEPTPPMPLRVVTPTPPLVAKASTASVEVAAPALLRVVERDGGIAIDTDNLTRLQLEELITLLLRRLR